MILPISKKYRLTSNAQCWQVERFEGSRKDGRQRWEVLSYHLDFKNALISLAERRIRLIDSSVPDEIIAAIQQIKQEVINTAEVFRELAK